MNIIVTTTDQIENRSIESYIGIVRTSAVVGNDVALADLFSSTARKYSRKLEAIYDKALRDIRLQALAVGANAVVGLHGEFEEVFGKGKTRFIVSLMGTAVSLSPSTQNESDVQGGGVSLYDIRRSQLSLMLTRKLENQQTNPSEEDWDNIIQYALFDIAPLLYKRYQVLVSETISSSSPTEKKLLLDNFIPFMRSLDYDSAVNTVYGDTQTAPYVFCDVVKACDLFCPEKICSMLSPENKHTIISLLESDKAFYTKDDLKRMMVIADFLDNLPDTGRYVEGRGGIFSKTGMLLVCERGHSSAVELGGHCTCQIEGSGAICNLNVKGITEREVATIRAFKDKIEILKSLINNE